MKFILHFFLLTLLSCSTVQYHDPLNGTSVRAPAEEISCTEMIKRFFKGKPEKTLEEVLIEKKLVTFSVKKAQIHYPSLEWINRAKKSLNTSLRNWNNNRYPSFYLFNVEEIVPTAKNYAENLDKIIHNTVAHDDQEITKAYVDVSDWIKSYSNYSKELDQLLEERISLQYNISLLKKIDLKSDETKDVEIILKRNGTLVKEIITLRKGDKNLAATINRLKLDMKNLDGSFLKNGRIKDRIIRQAMLQDMLTILHRELEFVVKNAEIPDDELIKELENLNQLIKKSDFMPSTYGVYKIENKIFLREMLAVSKLDKVYARISDPIEKLKTLVMDYFKNRNAGTDAEKIGIFKKMYLKITSITPKQAAIGGSSVAAAWIGYERYFTIKGPVESVGEGIPAINQMDVEDQAHQQQLDRTEKVETEKHEAHSSVVEIHIDELVK